MPWLLPVLVGASNLVAGVVALLLMRPLLRRRVPMNAWYGARFARSFESDRNRYDINEYGARKMIPWAWGLVTLGLLTPLLPLAAAPELSVLLAFAPAVYVIPCLQTWRYARSPRS